MDVWGWLYVAFALAVVVMLVWAVRRQRLMYPPDRPRVREPEERKGEVRWLGWIQRGGGGGL